jgi:beta-xylosidase
MKKYLAAAILITTLLSCSKSGDEVYMFSFFRGNGEDGLHLAWSEDGYHWEALNDNNSFLTPTAGADKLMRDPCIIPGGDGLFHMVWTVSWEEKGIGYARSEDLVNWSEQKYIPVMEHEPEAKNCWAPELFYDKEENQYMIYWSTTIPGQFTETDSTEKRGWNHRIYYVTTRDFKTFSETALLYDPGFNCIDAIIARHNGSFVMIVKNETLFPEARKDLHIAFSNSLTDGWGDASGPITRNWVEGPTITRIGEKWTVYFDRYREKKMGAIESIDLENWRDISDSISFPSGTRHGTVFKVKRDILDNLHSNYTDNQSGVNDPE